MKIRNLLTSVALVLALTASTPERHFALESSTPEAGETVSAPDQIVLTFTQEPQEGTVRIRLIEADEAGVHVMDAVEVEGDPLSFSIVIHGTLPPETYTVSWRGIGQDGHVVRDDFEFTVE